MEINKNYSGIVIENSEGKLLFQLRDNNSRIPNPNKWSLFGGGIEKGETPKQAAIRELNEELGIKIKKEQLSHLATFQGLKKKRYLFKLKLNSNLKLKLNEGSSIGFFTLGKMLFKKNVVLSLRLFLLFYIILNSFKHKK